LYQIITGALQDILHLHDVLARVYLAKLCHSISRARVLDQRPDIKSQYSSLLYQLLLDPSDRVCFEAINCVLGKVDNTESTEDRAGGWIRLTREILKLPEAPSVASKGVLSKSSEKSSKARRPQPLIKLVMRRFVASSYDCTSGQCPQFPVCNPWFMDTLLFVSYSDWRAHSVASLVRFFMLLQE